VTQPDSARELDPQFAEIDAVLRGPWVPPDAGHPRVLTLDAYAEARQSIKRGGLTSLDQATVEAVCGGAPPVTRCHHCKPSLTSPESPTPK